MSSHAPTILVVDDDPSVREHVARVLSVELPGARVVTAESGPAGLDALARERIDVIVSDQRMPGMEGSDFLAAASALSQATRRILLTAFADIDVAARALNQGHIHRLLQKPVTRDALSLAVRELLDDLARAAARDNAYAREIEAARRRALGELGP